MQVLTQPCVFCMQVYTYCGTGKTRTHCGGNIADVIMFPKFWLVLPCVQHLCPTQILLPGHIEMFLKIFRNISCVSTARNNVAAFCHGRATLQDTMLLPPCFLVLPWEVILQKAHPCSPKLLHSGDFLCWYVGPYFMTRITWALPRDALLLTNPVKAFETNDFFKYLHHHPMQSGMKVMSIEVQRQSHHCHLVWTLATSGPGFLKQNHKSRICEIIHLNSWTIASRLRFTENTN